MEDIELEFENAIKIGAKLIIEIKDHDWGDKVCYFADIDGHIIAFAEKLNNQLRKPIRATANMLYP